jgi:hypothetical protein
VASFQACSPHRGQSVGRLTRRPTLRENRPRSAPELELGLKDKEVVGLKQTINALCQFFRREVPRLTDTYDWKIPRIVGFPQAGESGYQPNLALKKHLKMLWDNAPGDERVEIAQIIVSDWGGVRSNRQETLENYVSAISKPVPPTPLQGVASYSKIFSIVCPERFAIYDARVAACLNALQVNAGIEKGVAFNYVAGRNNVVGNVAKKSGFTHDVRFSTKRLVQSGWLRIKRDQTYAKYLELLASCLNLLPDYNLASLGMALFASAECECKRAMTERIDPTISCTKRANRHAGKGRR